MKLAKLILLTFISNSYAVVPYNECFIDAANTYHIPKEILIAIASVESKFKPTATNNNKNGSYDMGIMQINSSWFNQLKKIGISQTMLADPCQNIMVGAWVLAQKINTYGFNWKAIQRYNGSDTQLKYAQKVYNEIKRNYPQFANQDEIEFKNQYHKSSEPIHSQHSITSKNKFLYVN
jgi:soluble lytic murein transglycosylase-like protein